MTKRYILALVIWLCGIALHAAAPPFPKTLDVSRLRELPVLFNNRYMPLDTMARMVVWKVTGEESYQGEDPVIVLLSWHFEPEYWAKAPIIPASNAKFRKAAGLDPEVSQYSLQSLYGHAAFSKHVASLRNTDEEERLSPLEKGVTKIRDRVTYLQKASMGSCIKIYPGQDKLGVPFYLSIFKIKQRATAEHEMIADIWERMRNAFINDDNQAFAPATEQFIAVVMKKHGRMPPIHTAEAKREIHYNTFPSLAIAWSMALIAMACGLIGVFKKHPAFRALTYAMIILSFILVNYHFILRGLLAQRLPAADFFESLLIIGWGALGFGALSGLFTRYWSIPLTCSGVGATALIMADLLPISRYISPVKPAVLNSFWMATHVPIIIVSYALLAVAVGIAHVQAISMAFRNDDEERTKQVNSMLHGYILFGSLLLLVGILTGAMWAANVWGTYWKWDPKEVWSLIAFLSYMVILHVRFRRPRVRWYHIALFSAGMATVIGCIFVSGLDYSHTTLVVLLSVVAICYYFLFADSYFATATKTVLAFWTIIMTYVGVNYLLYASDLQKYDFGSGVTAKRTITVGLLDLAFIAFCAWRYYQRPRQRTEPVA